DILLELGLVPRPRHNQVTNRSSDSGLDRFELAIGFVVFALDRFAQRGIFHLGNFFGVGAGSHGTPRGARVVEIPMFQREREAGAERESLAEDRQALLAASLEPRHAALMNFGIAAGGRYHIVQDW